MSKRYLTMLFPFLAVAAVGQGCGAGPNSDSIADRIREIEGQRLRALVTQDMEVARRLHAEDFQLFTPDGTEFTKESYLGLIESGQLDYRVWDAG